MSRQKSVKPYILLLTGLVFLAVSCPQPTSSGSSSPSATTPPAAPVAVITITSGAVPQGSLFQTTASTSISFSAAASSPVSGSTITDWEWDFDNGFTASGETTSQSFAANVSIYNVTLTVTDTEGRIDTDTVEILINDPPTISIDSGDEAVDEGVQITFTATGSDGDGHIASYLWDMGDGTTIHGSLDSGDPMPSEEHTYIHGGTFTVALTVTDDDGTKATDTVTAVITDPSNTPPEASFTTDDTDNRVNRNVNVTFDASTTTDDQKDQGLTYEWDFGDGTTGSGAIVSHSYDTGDDYTITLNVTDIDGAADATPATAVISVNYQPQVDFDADDPGDDIGYRVGENIQFSNNSTDFEVGVLTYEWSFGDGTSSNDENPSHSYSAAKDYTVSLTVTDSEGDSDIMSETITVNDPPEVTITGIPAGNWVNQGSAFTLTSNVDDDNDTIFTYLWDMGDGSTHSTASISHTYTTSVDRTVTLTVTDPTGHSDTDTVSLEVNAAPTVTFTASDADNRVNPGAAVDFDATAIEPDGDVLTYDWEINGTDFSALEDPSYTFNIPGSFTISLTVTDTRGAQDSDSTVITVNAPPIAAFTGPTYTLEGNNISFTSNSTDTEDTSLEYAWDFGGEGTSTEASPSFIFTDYGSYTVSLTVTDDDSLTSTATSTIEVNALPTAAITGTPATDTVDMGISFTLNGDTSGDPDDSIASYLWTMSDGQTYDSPNISHTYTSNADGDITLVVSDQDGETDTVVYAITVNEAPVALFTQNVTQINPGGTIDFDASNSNDPDSDSLTYEWDFGDSSTGSGISPSHTYDTAGDYTVALTVNDGRLDNSVTVTNLIRVNAAPDADAGPDQTVSGADVATTITLDGSSSSDPEGQALAYSWVFTSVPTDSSFTTGSATGLTSSTAAATGFSLSGESAAAQAEATLVYTLELTVTDSMGLSDTDDVTVTVDGTGLVNVTIE